MKSHQTKFGDSPTKQTQQSGFIVLPKPPSPTPQKVAKQLGSDIDVVRNVDIWVEKSQQLQTIKNKYKYKIYKGIPLYFDKDELLVCLFHGTTTNELPNFVQMGGVSLHQSRHESFFITLDLEIALRYALKRNASALKSQHNKGALPMLIVFSLPFKDMIKLMESKGVKQIDTRQVSLSRKQNIKDLTQKAKLIEMITIKPTEQKPKKTTNFPADVFSSLMSRLWTKK